ncbi:MAG: M14 family metallopeptidase [Saprospiraceae bacterium]
MKIQSIAVAFFLLAQLFQCFPGLAQQAQSYDFPQPVDTRSRSIKVQEKKTWTFGTVQASNQFDGARLNDFSKKNDSTFVATISPENKPVNASPWYAFKIWSAVPRDINLEIYYTEAEHRYSPKVSRDGKLWEALDPSRVRTLKGGRAQLSLPLGPDTLWVAAQEVVSSTDVRNWCWQLILQPNVRYGIAGKSSLGRDIPFLDIGRDSVEGQDMIILLSRQHPPEVTGFMALQAFMDALLADSPLANAFRQKYRILVFPLMNPDGVDLGHWRHNAGGVDLNRDWAYYYQPETRQVADYVVQTARERKNQVILGLDFHSTKYDVYYTCAETNQQIPGFKDYWLQGIAESIPDYRPRVEPFEIEQPISKSWFLLQFGAEGITFEIGDDTDREFIKVKGRTAAIEMMQLLIFRK